MRARVRDGCLTREASARRNGVERCVSAEFMLDKVAILTAAAQQGAAAPRDMAGVISRIANAPQANARPPNHQARIIVTTPSAVSHTTTSRSSGPIVRI
jgi:hypothetical protein